MREHLLLIIHIVIRAWYEQAKQYKEGFRLSEDTLDFRDPDWLEKQL